MAKFKVGDMVKVVRFDLSDARASMRWIDRNGPDGPKYFKVIDMNIHITDPGENSVRVDLISTHWWYPEDCLELQLKDSFRRRLVGPGVRTRRKRL